MNPDRAGHDNFDRVGVSCLVDELTLDLSRRLEHLGFRSLWVGGSPGGNLTQIEAVLAATDHLVVATGVVNIWTDDAADIARAFHRIDDRHPGRLLLGVGIGHRELSDIGSIRPYDAMVRYLDALAAAEVESSRTVLAALGPRVLRLAAERTLGSYTNMSTSEYTATARAIAGPDAIIALQRRVVLNADPHAAREIARPYIHGPLDLENYRQHVLRQGFTIDELAIGHDNDLIDRLVAHGDPDAIAEQLRAHLDAGADQVVVQLKSAVGADQNKEFAELAQAIARL
jgi:probable F420-dependent oxidoreductase